MQIDREKAKSLQVPFTQITDALQVYMGSVYVNDFDFNNRSYRVYVQAEGKYRSEAEGHPAILLAVGHGEDDSAGQSGDGGADGESASDQPLQSCSARRKSTDRRAPGRSSGEGDRGDGSAGEESAAATE